ncbi:MAG: hydrogenase maturation protease [Bacteroidales bacterium]|nr:hydrogenase maturation protease [Bacteroidales bacterium]
MKGKVKKILCRNGSKILFAGVGNVLRRDDGAGVYIVSGIKAVGQYSKLLVEASIENYISKINSLAPDRLIIADCIDFNREPGYSGLVPIGQIHEFDVSSHNISLRRVADHLKMEVHVIGVQPADLRVGENMTPAVKKASDEIIKLINDIIYSQIKQ